MKAGLTDRIPVLRVPVLRFCRLRLDQGTRVSKEKPPTITIRLGQANYQMPQCDDDAEVQIERADCLKFGQTGRLNLPQPDAHE